jgi:hypothetical protein
MSSGGPSAAIIQSGIANNVTILDPTIPGYQPSQIIGTRPGTRYGLETDTMDPDQLKDLRLQGSEELTTTGGRNFIELTESPIATQDGQGRENEVKIDISEGVTGETAFQEMMEAFANDQEKWEQIAEGLFVNDFIPWDGDVADIYDYDTVVDGMLAAVQEAGKFSSLGGISVGMMPTTDALLSAVSAEDLQAKIDEVTATKKPTTYSKETIIEYANTAFKKRLQRAPTSGEIKSVIGFVHNLQNTENLKFDLGAEIGAKAEALDPQRAEGISYYNTAQTVKNALGLK